MCQTARGVARGKSNIFSSNSTYSLQSLIRAELSFCSCNPSNVAIVPEILNYMNQNHSIIMLGNAYNLIFYLKGSKFGVLLVFVSGIMF